jgi:hypothetical protein
LVNRFGNRSLSTSGHVVSRGQFVGQTGRRLELLRRSNVVQITVTLLLVWAAYWAALPWIDCLRAFPVAVPMGDSVRYCTFGVPGFLALRGWNLLAGGLYVGAAIWSFFRRT